MVNNPAKKSKSSQTPVLDEFGIDLTANEGQSDPLIGRQFEVERLMRVLTRKETKNPIIIGERGIGKSAIVMGFAGLLTKPWAPKAFFGRRVVSIDIPFLIVHGSGHLKTCLIEAEENNVILILEQVLSLFGPPLISLLNLEFFAKPNVSCIGVAELNDYQKMFAQDKTLMKYFQPIAVKPSTIEESIAIIGSTAKLLEAFHCVSVADDAIQESVRMSDLYITNRYLPGKAIQVLDRACALTRMCSDRTSPLRALRQFQSRKAMIKMKDPLDCTLDETEKQLIEAVEAYNSTRALQPPQVTKETVAMVVSAWQSAESELLQ